MSKMTCRQILDSYCSHLNQNFSVKKTDYGCAITTPYLKTDNDPIIVYIEDIGFDQLKITDYGDTLYELDRIELDYSKGKRGEYFSSIIDSNGARYNKESNSIEIICNQNEISKSISNLIQALIDLSHFHYFSRPITDYDFKGKVHEYLRDNGIEHDYEREGTWINFKGSQLKYDLIVPSRQQDSYGGLIQAFHVEDRTYSPQYSRLKTYNFMIMKVEKANFTAISIIDDLSGSWTKKAIANIERASDVVFDWAEREKAVDYFHETQM